MHTGLVSLFYGVAMLLGDEFFPIKTAEFFDVDPLIEYEDTYVTDTSEQNVQNGDPTNAQVSTSSLILSLTCS